MLVMVFMMVVDGNGDGSFRMGIRMGFLIVIL